MPTKIFHITHIRNLPSILQAGGLIAVNQLRNRRIQYQNIAYERIQDQRARTIVPETFGKGGVLHDYVPFYFAPRSPMLYTINRGNVPDCPEGQTPILHLVTTAEAIEQEGIAYTFTDGHAIMAYSEFYYDLELMETVIDWEVMESSFWADTEDDPDRKRRRQAEFLAYRFVPWPLITEIGVSSSSMQEQVLQILQNIKQAPPVVVHHGWYY